MHCGSGRVKVYHQEDTSEVLGSSSCPYEFSVCDWPTEEARKRSLSVNLGINDVVAVARGTL